MQRRRELRREPRLLCSHLVTVRWPGGSSGGVLENISAGGACVQAERPVAESEPVRLRADKVQFRGTVRYCLARDGAYFLGIRFDEDSRWSRSKFQPGHLIDPAEVRPAGTKPGQRMM